MVSGLAGEHQVDVLISGVGMVATAVWATRVLSERRYDAALNLGVCGSFKPSLLPPAVAHVTSDMLPELGVQDGPRFLRIEDIGLVDPEAFPFTAGRLVNASPPRLPGLADLPVAAGITVNTVHGDDAAIAAVEARCSPDVESMEGAAFMFACLAANLPFAQVRAVSNRVERRNRAAWDMTGAIDNLGRVSLRLLGRDL